MEKEFINYNQALKLKELGFDEPCFGFYQLEYGEIRPTMVDDDEQYRLTGWRTCKNSEIPKHYTSAPTFSQAFRWFREKYGVHSSPRKYDETNWWVEWGVWTSSVFKTFEEAELVWLDKLIEILENEKPL